MDKKDELQVQFINLRAGLMKEMPFYGEMLSHFDIMENNSIPSAGTDGRVIYYNRKFLTELTEGARNYVIMHELMHIILCHPYRADGKNEVIWNVSADYVANSMLDKLIYMYKNRMHGHTIKFQRPPCGCFLNNYSGESVEELYHNIYERNKEKLKKLKRIILEVRDRYGNKQMQRIKVGDLDLILNIEEDEMGSLEERVRQWTEEALKNWSNDPSSEVMRQKQFEFNRAKALPWKVILKRFLGESETVDVSYDHPERKYLHMGLILPGEGRETEEKQLDNVWAFIDTSGSIGADENNKFISQLYHICKQYNARINIGYWDTIMHEVYRNVSDVDLVKTNSVFCGGTNANAVYDYLDSNKIKANVILILTDGNFYPVDVQRIKPYFKKTIVVLSREGNYHCADMGKIARL